MYVLSPLLLHTLQLVGLLPFSLTRVPLRGEVARRSTLWLLYTLLLVLTNSAIFCGWVYVTFLRNFGRAMQGQFYTTTSVITTMCSALSTFLATSVCLFVALLRSPQKILILEKLKEMDFQLHRRAPAHKTRVITHFFLVYFIIMTIYEVQHHYKFNTMYSLYVLTKILIMCGMVEIMEIILGVKDRFRLLNHRIEELVLRSRSKQLLWTITLPCVETLSTPQVMSLTIPDLSDTHWNLCCVVYDINIMYGSQFVVLMVHIFAHLVFYPYYFVMLYPQDSVVHKIFVLNWILVYVAKLYILVWPCSQAVAEARKTVVVVSKMLGNKLGKPHFKELEHFAQQLFHRDVDFSACGLFSLHTSIIVSVASAVTTYLAIIIQFQESSVDETTANTR